MNKENPCLGPSLTDELKEEGILVEVRLGSTKKILDMKLTQLMKQQNISAAKLA